MLLGDNLLLFDNLSPWITGFLRPRCGWCETCTLMQFKLHSLGCLGRMVSEFRAAWTHSPTLSQDPILQSAGFSVEPL